jgi:hypothetical protein
LDAVNNIEFSQEFIDTLRRKLFLSYPECEKYIREYKKFVLMVACTQYMVSPSEQVDQVWHLHQNFNPKKYREDCTPVFGRILIHCPSLGGPSEDAKYEGIYDQTVQYYHSLFNNERPKEIWEPLDERF